MDEQHKLRSGSISEREAAAETLSQMGADAAFAAIELVDACADDPAVQQWAVAALEELGAPPAELIDELTKRVASTDPLTAYWAVTLLGRAEAAATSSQDLIASVLTQSSEPAVKERAAWALGKIHATSAATITALEQAAASPHPRLSGLAKAALGQPQRESI